ncbi:MAG: outer membrane lipoprotein chaperone LolA [Gammaproteobacteria bacterium]|nr:outer membrane lipoprotein chaperone LolA [Pseudomonadales bacterium]MCP5346193.1 outer membrane lipoprotein chaperone LolA [Pseudomonadales bacterium]
MTSYKPIFTRLAMLLLLLAGPLANAQGDQEINALARLDELLSGITTMTADVDQLIVESDGGVLEESSIRMKLKRPDGFYWETLEPFPELIVTDGRFLWNYQPDLEQVVVENWDASRSELAAQLLSGNTANLTDEYRLSQRANEAPEISEFVLVPLEPDNVYRQIILTFNGRQLDMIYVDNNNGQKTVWQFGNIVLNKPLADQEFVFEPSGDVEVIENTYVQ